MLYRILTKYLYQMLKRAMT